MRPRTTRAQILIIADEPDVAYAAKQVLVAAGYDVVHAGTGPAGVHRAVSEQPDAIVVDMKLPRGKGRHTLGFLRRSFRTRHIPVVVVAAAGEDAPHEFQNIRLIQRRSFEPHVLIRHVEEELKGAA